ncbi:MULTISPECIES: hypothetical protein [unclassified Empedobacter]|uniref:hypothetical protein n=1 Tax=unclassified Empedobacter TaxID=2643773 RepID=UPI0025C32B7B|nr:MULTISPECIES: hypothetical protein [unclassified Empedobacter]
MTYLHLAAINTENLKINNLKIQENNAQITNAAIYFWLEKNTSMNNIFIEKNTVTSNHIYGESMLYNGTQGLLADAKDEKNTYINSLVIRNNTITIKSTEIKGRAVKYATKYKFKDENNNCVGCKDGVFFK